ncbi:MAG TPA: trypsin-like peptidase domain-containing protein [Sedimentisphaerales bacterium]|nr:trypsin-like peptidase domain-containing protein [Sedimentisphaerales bacterium]HNU31545.1 trypsin-like peptidase domain-containing protein [Sedimentisphaerales bacterium]
MSAHALMILFAAASPWLPPGPAAGQEHGDFREIISRAKSEVFPALIFVKPIVVDYGSGEKKHQEVFGSGVIVSPDGYAVTNWHVVDKAVTINCVLHDKRQVPVELIGSDRDTDLALLKLPALPEGRSYPSARFADATKVHEGDFVMALGSPFGFQRSISLGIISNAQRYIGFETEYKYNTWLQTDAAINPGNSGGPLIDTSGAIVGINTLGVEGSGLGFSIPASTVQDTAERLKRDGRVIRAYTGLRLQALKDFHSNTFVEAERGVLIAGVEENSPAARASVRAGDILVSIGEDAVEGAYAEMLPEIWRRLADLPIDEPVAMEFQRGSERVRIEVTPEQKGVSEGEDFDCRRWNMTVKEINKYLTPQLYYLREKGVYIQGTRYPGNAETSGLSRRDILLTIDKEAVETIADVKRVYERVLRDDKREKKVVVEVLRAGLRKWIVLDYRRDYEEE